MKTNEGKGNELWPARAGTKPKPKWDFGWAQPNFVRLVTQTIGIAQRVELAAVKRLAV